MTKKYDALVFLGRFQPFHRGHQEVIDRALELAHNVVIGIGSANLSRSIKNPWTAEERIEMIQAHYKSKRLAFVQLNDYRYDDQKWLAEARGKLNAVLNNHCEASSDGVGLIGHEKDGTSFYLKMFPEWKSESVPNYSGLNATDIREYLLSYRWGEQWLKDRIPQETVKCLKNIIYADEYGTPRYEFDLLLYDYKMVQDYKKSWEAAPYPPTFVTVDAVVTASGHALLVERAASPGKGLSALPGGFLNPEETLKDGAIRELREETKLKVPAPVLRGSIKSQHTFDHPHRSSRGRTITTAFHIDLGMVDQLPKVKGSDDAAKAFWIPLKDIDPRRMFEDHMDIISHFTGI